MRGAVQTLLPTMPGGVREDLNPAMLPDGVLLDSTNYLVRRGVGQTRPGYTSALLAPDAKRVIGIGIRGTRNQTSNIIIATTDHTYTWDGSTVTDSTGSGWSVSANNQHVRMVTFSQGGVDYALTINEANALREWNGSGNFTATAGSPPAGRDLTIAGNRVIIAYPATFPHRIRWSGFNDRTVWGASAYADLLDTPGSIIAARAFGPNTFGVYKDDAIYLATLQAAVEPFQFQFIARAPGPASPASLVDALGVHYWLGEDYAIYKFDGASPKVVSTGLARTISKHMDFANRDQMFGFPWFSQDERELWFFYPTRVGTFNAVSYNIGNDAVNHHKFPHVITAAMDWKMQSTTMSIDDLTSVSATIDGLDASSSTIDNLDATSGATRAVLFGDSTGTVFTFGPYHEDNGTAIDWSFTHGWVSPGKLQSSNYMDSLTPYWIVTPFTNVTIRVGLTVTDQLSDTETETITEFNSTSDSPHRMIFPNTRGKLIKVRQFGRGTERGLFYQGSLLTTWNKGRV